MSIRSLGQLAVVLVLIFALQIGAVLLPLQPLDPAWQWRLANTLINAALVPLLALAILQIAVMFDPQDPVLIRRHHLFLQLAVVATIGYLLLLPLQFSAGLSQQNLLSKAQLEPIVTAQKRLDSLRQLTTRASSIAELNSGLQKWRGPVLSPADLANPLPLVKAQLNEVFDQAQIQINRDRAALPVGTAATIAALPELLRNSFSCILLAIAFATLARRNNARFSLLDEAWLRFLSLKQIRPRRNHNLSEMYYLDPNHDKEEEA